MKQLNRTSITILVLVCAILGGCGRGERSTKLFVMVPKGVHPYYEPCFEGFRDAGSNYGITVEYQAPLNFELPQQVKVLEDLVARQVDGIAISAVDNEGLVPVIKDAMASGIKVLTFDAPAPASDSLSYIGTMNETAGYAAGEYLAGLLPEGGEVAVLQGGLGAPNLNSRFRGFEKALMEKGTNISIVAREDTEGKMNLTMNKTEGLLEAHPQLKAIFGVSAYGAPGAATVIKEQDKAGKIIIGGFDDMPDTLDAIREGTVQFCIAQKTYKMGWLAVEKLLQACEGKPIDREIDTGVIFVTKDNVDTYMQDMREEFE